jgi:pilus assembly protein CpaE
LQAGHPGIVVAAAHTVSVSDLILAALRAGARDYLGPPFQAEALERLLLLPGERRQGFAPGRLICFMPARGGCGSSTVALHVAAAIARESGTKVLLVDFDFHTGTVDLRLGLQPKFTLADALQRGTGLDELWGQITCPWGGVEVLAPPPFGVSLEAEALRDAPAVFQSAKRAYDWVVCDLPSVVYTSAADVLAQAEEVYVVCTPELASLQLARRRVQQLYDLVTERNSIRLVVNRIGRPSSMSAEEVAKAVGVKVAWAFENDYDGVNAAILEGQLVSGRSKLGRQFAGFARQTIGLPPEPEASDHGFDWRSLFRLGTASSPSRQGPDKERHPAPEDSKPAPA